MLTRGSGGDSRVGRREQVGVGGVGGEAMAELWIDG